MTGRASAFSDPDIIRMASHDFVPVTGDDWYERRRQDAVGQFFRGVAKQGPRSGTSTSTNQGIYFFTASGKLLAYKNAGQNAAVMRDVFREALAKWERLPESERRPEAIVVPPLEPSQLDPRYSRSAPDGGLVVNVYTRSLERDSDGNLQTCQEKDPTGLKGFQTALDHLWLKKAEWKSLLPADPQAGQTYSLPAPLAARIARFHLVDNTRGEPNMWQRAEIRRQQWTVTVTKVTQAEVQLQIEGAVLLATHPDLEQAARGYDASVLGYLHYNRQTDKVERMDLAVLGDHWGHGNYTRGARPGRTPLAVYFELASGQHPADFIPPQAMRDPAGYYAAD